MFYTKSYFDKLNLVDHQNIYRATGQPLKNGLYVPI